MKDQNFLIQNGVDLETSLELFGDIGMYNESLNDFLLEITGKIEKIKRFKESKDMDNYAIIVHSIKSDAKYFGFTQLGDMALEHEAQSKAKNALFVSDNFDALIMEINKVVNIVKQYLGAGGEPVEESAGEAITPMQPEQTPAPSNEPPKILVVDDSDIIKNFIQRKFESKYKILIAADGAEAIEEIKKDLNIAAMLLDLNMPNVNGFEVLDYMRSQDLFKHVPVSVITGNDNKEIDDKAFEYPIVDILKKPFNEYNIKSVVERTVNKSNN